MKTFFKEVLILFFIPYLTWLALMLPAIALGVSGRYIIHILACVLVVTALCAVRFIVHLLRDKSTAQTPQSPSLDNP